MKLVGVAIGALMIGGAVIYLIPTASAQTSNNTDNNTDNDTDSEVRGCMDSKATNYNSNATIDEGCTFADTENQEAYEEEKKEEEEESQEQAKEDIISDIKSACPGLYNSNNTKKGQESKEQIKLKDSGAIGCAI